MSVMIKCSKEAFEKCPYQNICGDAEDAFFMDGSDCDKFNQSLNPYTVDAVPVVRCRDCKNWEPYGSKAARNIGDPLERYGGCKVWHGGHLESDFCSYGERNEDENGRN